MLQREILVVRVARPFGLSELIQTLKSCERKAVAREDLRVFRLLELLAKRISVHLYDQCIPVIQELVGHARTEPELATTLFVFLLCTCSAVQYDLASFHVLLDFCKQLAPHFKSHQLFKALVLSMMSLAVRVDGPSEKLAELRELNSEMGLADTVICRAHMFAGLPAECFPLVHCGLGLQVSVDAAKLNKSVNFWDVLELCCGIVYMFSDSPSPDNLNRGLSLAIQALESCQVPQTPNLNYDLISKLVDTAERSTLANKLRAKLSMHTSFSGMVDVYARLIRDHEASIQLPHLLASLGIYLRERWPEEDQVDLTPFTQLRELLGHLFTSLSFYPTDEDAGPEQRTFRQQLKTLERVVHVYLRIMSNEVGAGTDWCQLMEKAEEVRGWLMHLLDQRVDITRKFEFVYNLNVVRGLIGYALRVTGNPQLVRENGVPPY